MQVDKCNICPRKCAINRGKTYGFCGGGANVKIAKATLHYWEEPCISGEKGSGTVFFSGCSLKCCFCQNFRISAENFGVEVSTKRLSEIFLELQFKGANNINLVNPTHYIPWIIEAIQIVKHDLTIPIVYNSSGYENIESIKMLNGYVDVYLPDLKYYSSAMSMKYSNANDYFCIASNAIQEMYEQVGKFSIDDRGIMTKGLIIRHMVLPTGKDDSVKILEWIYNNFDSDNIKVSIMSQYTPFYKSAQYNEINRRIFTFEYQKVAEKACQLGLKGYIQEKDSAKEEYTPDFDLTGI